MKIFDNIMEWLRHSEAGRTLTIIEKRIISSSNDTVCPTCKYTSIKKSTGSHYMADMYYCDVCGFSYSDEYLPSQKINQGVQTQLIDQQKARVLKIKKIQKENEARRNRVKSI